MHEKTPFPSRLNRRQFLRGARALVTTTLWNTRLNAMPPKTRTYPLEVFPPEHRRMKDTETGVDLLFITTHPARDVNLYFHERSFLADESMLLFTSERERGGVMGYLFATGELVRLTTLGGDVGGAIAAKSRNSVFVLRGKQVLQLALKIAPSTDPLQSPSQVFATERVICTLPEHLSPATALNENANGSLLSLGVNFQEGGMGIITIDVQTGEVHEVCRVEFFSSHVLWSRMSPHLLSFAGRRERLMVVDIRDGKPRAIYHQSPGELVTHEHWWVNDQILFCGGHRDGESHVKVIDVATGVVRIIGAGAWWEGGTPAEYAKVNWWYTAGDENGKWVVAGNWHGIIALFDGKTTRMHVLTTGHRTYGTGAGPVPSWDRRSKRVVFTSHKLGNPNVCVATIPEEW
jgi:oligogalacturonide lyase